MKTEFHFKRWVHQEDYHITLAFLGHADEEQLQVVMNEVRGNLLNVSPVCHTSAIEASLTLLYNKNERSFYIRRELK